MNKKEFQTFLERQGLSINTINSLIEWAIESEKYLNRPFEDIVKNEDETSNALDLLKKVDSSFGLTTQYPLKKYYEFVNGKSFPKPHEYQPEYSNDKDITSYTKKKSVIDSYFIYKKEYVSLYEMGLSEQLYNLLRRMGIDSLNDLLLLTLDDLKMMHCIGRSDIEEIEKKLYEFGFKLMTNKEKEDAIKKFSHVRLEALGIHTMRLDKAREKYNIVFINDLDEHDLLNKLGSLTSFILITRLKELGVPYAIYKGLCQEFASIILREENEELQNELTFYKDTNLEECNSDSSSLTPVPIELWIDAVNNGYRGNYSMIGLEYFFGINITEVDKEKGRYWLQRFYNDYKNGLIILNEDDTNTIIDAFFILAIDRIWKKQDESQGITDISEELDILRAAVDLAEQYSDGITSPSAKDRIYGIGWCFYYGKIHSDEHEDVEIKKDYDYAYKALQVAVKFDIIDAFKLMAEIYEKGVGAIKEDKKNATNFYLRAALAGDEDGLEWCQKNLIDTLPWNKRNDWSLHIVVEYHLYRLGIRRVSDCRNGLFEKAAKSKKVYTRRLKEIIETLKQYMNDVVSSDYSPPT